MVAVDTRRRGLRAFRAWTLVCLGLVVAVRSYGQDASPTGNTTSAGWDGGFFIGSADGEYRLAIGLVAQVDARASLDTPAVLSTLTTRKLRPTLTGRLGRFFEFKVMPDFGSGNTVVADAYVDLKITDSLRVRTGKDKTPIGYELLQGDAFLLFPERTIATGLVPNRDIGIQVQGGGLRGRLAYTVGLFNGIPDGTSASADVDTNDGKDLAGRIVLRPFVNAAAPRAILGGLGVHVGGSLGRQVGTLPVFRTDVGQPFFAYAPDASAAGTRHRVSPAVFYYHRSFGGFAEYMRSAQRVGHRVGGVDRTTDIVNDGWEITASYLLTGEPASDRGVRPARPFDPANRRWGALQVLGRYSRVHLDSMAFAEHFAGPNASDRAAAVAIAVNWYPTAFVRYYATFERTTFGEGTVARAPERAVVVRTQVAF